MENQTTAPIEQSEQQQPVATENTEATAEVQTTTLAQQPADVQTTSFKDLLPEEFREEKSLQNFNNMEDFVKSYISAQKLVGANKIAVPNKMATDDDWQQVFRKLGAPEKPEDYKYDIKEEQINQDQLKSFNETAHRLGLLPQQAERLMKFYFDMNDTAAQQALKSAEDKQIQVETELKKEFGAQYGKRIDQARKLAQETFGTELLNNTMLQDGSRLGDHPEVIKAFSMLADKLSEDEIIKGDGVGYMTASEIEKEISELTDEGSAYWNKNHPNHKKTVDQVLKLREQLNG